MISPAERRLAGLDYKRSAPVGVPPRPEKELGPRKPRTSRLRPVGRRAAELSPERFGAQAAACRVLPCYVCGAHGSKTNPVDPHHEPPVEKGGLDRDTVPLCRYGCHVARHNTTAEAFWAAADLDPEQAKAAVREWIAEGQPSGIEWEHTSLRDT